MANEQTAATGKKELIGWGVTALVTVATYFLASGSGAMNEQQVTFLAVTMCMIFITAFELLPNLVIAVVLPFSYLFLGLAKASVIFASWQQNVVWMMVGAMLAASVLQRIGLLKRMVYWCVGHFGGSYRTIILAFGVAGIAMAFLTPSAPAKAVILATLAYALITSLGLEHSRTAAGIMLGAALSMGTCFIYAPGIIGVMVSGANTVTTGISADYVSFFTQTWPWVIVWLLMLLLVPVLFKQDREIDAAVIRRNMAELGPMSSDEKKGTILSICFVVLILSSSFTGLELVYCFVLFALSFYLPGIGVGRGEDAKKVNFSLIFFVAAFISIGSVAAALGFNEVISALLTPMLAAVSNNMAICTIVYLFGFIINFLMTPLAAASALTAPVVQVAVDLGIGVYPAMWSFYYGLENLLLPYEVAPMLVFYAYNQFNFKDFAKVYGVKAVICLVLVPLVCVPWWSFLGIM